MRDHREGDEFGGDVDPTPPEDPANVVIDRPVVGGIAYRGENRGEEPLLSRRNGREQGVLREGINWFFCDLICHGH